MENQEKGEPFANLNPPRVLRSFLIEDELVTLTESFTKTFQVEVYNFQTKVVTWVQVAVFSPIPKEWKLESICSDSRSSILLLGRIPLPSDPNFDCLQIYVFQKLSANPTRQGSNQRYSCAQLKISHPDLIIRTHQWAGTLNLTPEGLICFLSLSQGISFGLFKAKLEDIIANAGGGGGLFGSAQAPGHRAENHRFARHKNEESALHSGCCSVMREDGKLYIFGGEDQDGEVLSELWEFDTKTDKWTDLRPKDGGGIFGRTGAIMCTDGDKLYICGGRDSKGSSRDDLIIYDLDSDIWRVFRLELFDEAIHSCFYYCGQLLIVRGRRVDVVYNNESKPYFEIPVGLQGEGIDGDLLKDYKKLFCDMPYHDVTFKVEDQEISAHRALLSIRCPHFLQVFPSEIKDLGKKVIEVPDIKANVFKGLLEYLYCEEVPQEEDVVIELLKASEKYQIEELREKCQEYLVFSLRRDNVANLATLARSHKASQLKTAVLKFIKVNQSKFDEGDFNQFDKDFLIEIIMYTSKNC